MRVLQRNSDEWRRLREHAQQVLTAAEVDSETSELVFAWLVSEVFARDRAWRKDLLASMRMNYVAYAGFGFGCFVLGCTLGALL